MHIHRAVERCLIDGNFGKAAGLAVLGLAHQVTEHGGSDAVVPLGHHVEAVLGRGIAEVIRQQGVHHHAAQEQTVTQQDQAVVFSVLQRFGVFGAAQPGGELLQHDLKWQLGSFRGLMPHRDVSQVTEPGSPAHTDAHQLGLEGVQIRGFGVHGHRFSWVGAPHQLLHQALQLILRADHQRRELGKGGFGDVRRRRWICACDGGIGR